MSLLDGLLGQITENVDIKNLAANVGITPEQAESAVLALGKAHSAPTDTVETASAETGLDSGTLNQIVDHIGGESSLGKFAGLLGNQDDSGGILSKLGGLAGGLFGGKS